MYTETQSLFDFQIPEDTIIPDMGLNINCLPFRDLAVSPAFKKNSDGNKTLKSISSKCTTCQGKYMPTDGKYSVYYTVDTATVQIRASTSGQLDPQCTDCPYGGDCSGAMITSKPNFWGCAVDTGILFQQCPLDFCCDGTKLHPCHSYNSCSGQRTGFLCGTCSDGFTMSMLSNNCVDHRDCDPLFFWSLAICCVFLYMLWYTFKDDIMGFPFYVLEKLKEKFKKNSTKSLDEESDDIDKGYFGIMSYFVQAAGMMRLSFSLDSIDTSTEIVQEIEKYVSLLLSIELTYISQDLCASKDFRMSQKFIYKFCFFLGIYASWVIVYAMFLFTFKILCKVSKANKVKLFHELNLRFVKGLVEIVKYTYGGLAGLVFMSLTCSSVDNNRVWLYDGTVRCYTSWQTWIASFCVVYVLPFPFTILLGMKLLERSRISCFTFLLGCVAPLPFLVFWAFSIFTNNGTTRQSNKIQVLSKDENGELVTDTQEPDTNNVAEEVLSSLQGTYRVTSGGAQYWESVMVLRRLLLGVTILIPRPLLQMVLCSSLSLIFLIHHIYVMPFSYKAANHAESISLFQLCVVSVISVLKATYVQLGLFPEGPNVVFFEWLRFLESFSITLLIICIIVLEFRVWYAKKREKRQ